jgi:hypothetical protein
MIGKITDIKKNQSKHRNHGRIWCDELFNSLSAVHYFFIEKNPGTEDLKIGDLVAFELVTPGAKDEGYSHRNTIRNVVKV